MGSRCMTTPGFVAACLSCLLSSCVLLAGCRDHTASSGENKRELEQLASILKESEARLARIEETLAKLQQASNDQNAANVDTINDSFEFHTEEEAAQLIQKLGESPNSKALADAIATIDGWLAKPEDVELLGQFKDRQIAELRRMVKSEVVSLHSQALKAENGSKCAELFAQSSQILALYPMDSTELVLEEARVLSAQHSEVGQRIEVIRRQRYNAWSMAQIEATIKAVNATASSLKSSDNPLVIDAVVSQLGQVDPVLLEPAVAQLYNFAIEKAKSSITSDQNLELARRLVDPAIKRKGYGDF